MWIHQEKWKDQIGKFLSEEQLRNICSVEGVKHFV